MKIVYIAGKYSAPFMDYCLIDENINEARKVAAWVSSRGIGFICPALNSAHFEVITPVMSEEWWKELDMKLLAMCDGIVLVPGWQDSPGAVKELDWWISQGWEETVFHFDTELRDENWNVNGRQELMLWGNS